MSSFKEINAATENRAFELMKNDGIAMIRGKDPEKIASRANVFYDEGKEEFAIPSLGKVYTVSSVTYDCMEEIDEWHYLTMLHYLNMADGTPVYDIPGTMSQMPGGLVRGSKFDQTAARALENFVKKHSEEKIKKFFASIGGGCVNGKADLNIKVQYLPNLPLYFNIWFADEEFPPSARMLVDASISHYLTIEDAVTMGEYILRLLEQ